MRLSYEDVNTERAFEKVAKMLKPLPSAGEAIDNLVAAARKLVSDPSFSDESTEELCGALVMYDASRKPKETKWWN